jgi:YesN/AraC family two-component response regulator
LDIDVAEYQNEESFVGTINQDQSITHFVIIKSSQHTKRLINRTHPYSNVHSVYLQCQSSELKSQRRLARQYSKLDAVFDEPLRLMIALIMDMALFFEETADRSRDEESSMKMVHQNYQRSVDLYGLAERLV